MKKFQYKTITIPITAVVFTNKQFEKIAAEYEEQLNALGAEGWELILRNESIFFFKREL